MSKACALCGTDAERCHRDLDSGLTVCDTPFRARTSQLVAASRTLWDAASSLGLPPGIFPASIQTPTTLFTAPVPFRDCDDEIMYVQYSGSYASFPVNLIVYND